MKICLLCKLKFEEGGGTSFHRFPDISDPGPFSDWVKSCGLEKCGVPKSSWVCGNHFKPDDFVGPANQRRLVRTAVPSRPLPSYTVPKHLPLRTAAASPNAMPPAYPAAGIPRVLKPSTSLVRKRAPGTFPLSIEAKRICYETPNSSAGGPYTKR